MRPVLCLLPSPLLGPACWRAVGDRLTAGGWEVATVPTPRGSVTTAADVAGELRAAIPPDREAVLVAHSNAGLFVPLLAASRPRVTGYVFVDAGLPRSGAQRILMVPAGLYDMLAGLAGADGLLPVWTAWWGDEDLSALFPDDKVRAGVAAEQRRLPLSYFSQSVPVPPGWPARPGAYLAFGEGYAAERATARELGWPTRTLAGEHLHMLVNPAQVATEIAHLVRSTLSAARCPQHGACHRLSGRTAPRGASGTTCRARTYG